MIAIYRRWNMQLPTIKMIYPMTKRVRNVIILAALATSGATRAQTGSMYSNSVDLNIGNIVAPHLLHGDMWWDPATGAPKIQFPKGVTGTLGGTCALFAAGKLSDGTMVGATGLYRVNGADFWPGPVGTISSDARNNPLTAEWAKIWRVERSTIDSFLRLSTHTLANTPASILEWPGKGNTNAKGRNGSSLNVSVEMAPFADLNGNGVYEPLSGEYPQIKGDQMLWWIINDNSTLPNSGATPIGLEIRISAYAYATRTLTDNIIFYEYDLKNAGTSRVTDFVFSPIVDLDMNYAFNDYVGFDSARRVAISYDQSGFPAGISHQAAGMVMLEQPGDAWNRYTPVGAMNYFRNEAASAGSDPGNLSEAYNYMTGYDRVGNKRVPNSNYAINGLKAQCDATAVPGDLRIVLAATPVVLEPAETRRYAFALVAADSVGACPGTDFSALLETVDSAYSAYYHPVLVTPGTPTSVTHRTGVKLDIYPNPVDKTLFISHTQADATVRVTNAIGAVVNPPLRRRGDGFELDASALPTGMYYLELRSKTDGSVTTARFIRK